MAPLIESMPRPRPPHLHREPLKRGEARWYVRVGHGPRIRIRQRYGTRSSMRLSSKWASLSNATVDVRRSRAVPSPLAERDARATSPRNPAVYRVASR